MSEKQKHKPEQTAGGNGGGGLFDSAAPVTHPMASVSSGPYAEDLPVAGLSVGEIRKRFATQLDIAPRSQAIINGHGVDDATIVKTAEHLMFIQHAGEKGGTQVLLDGNQAVVEGSSRVMAIADLASRMGPKMSTGPVVLPNGIKAVLSSGRCTIWVWEKPPHIAQLSWIREDSPRPYGPGTTYRNVRIALPYLIVIAVFWWETDGMPRLLLKDECFFRGAPLKSLEDELCFPGLLNCSKFPGDPKQTMNPLSWICTQHLKKNRKMQSAIPGDRLYASFEAVRYCLLETSFNLSSEHNEGNSWYGETKKVDPRLSTIGKWESATQEDPTFILTVPWITTGHTLGQVAERIFKNNQQPNGAIASADDVARIILNR